MLKSNTVVPLGKAEGADKDGLATLGCSEEAGSKGLAIAQTLDLVDHREVDVARENEVAVQTLSKSRPRLAEARPIFMYLHLHGYEIPQAQC